MPNVDDLKQSNYLSQKEVEPPKLVTIRSYKEVNVAKEGADPEYRWTLLFDELDKPMTLNSTNGQIIRAITGSNPLADDEFAEWIGHKIVLYRDPNVGYRGKITGGIRCRAPRQQVEPTIPEPDPSIQEQATGDDIPF